jgi:hypothetical protein
MWPARHGPAWVPIAGSRPAGRQIARPGVLKGEDGCARRLPAFVPGANQSSSKPESVQVEVGPQGMVHNRSGEDTIPDMVRNVCSIMKGAGGKQQ